MLIMTAISNFSNDCREAALHTTTSQHSQLATERQPQAAQISKERRNYLFNTRSRDNEIKKMFKIKQRKSIVCNQDAAQPFNFITIIKYILSIWWKELTPQYMYVNLFNPLWTKFFFSSFFETYPKIGSFRLPTHRHDAHRKFFDDPLLK